MNIKCVLGENVRFEVPFTDCYMDAINFEKTPALSARVCLTHYSRKTGTVEFLNKIAFDTDYVIRVPGTNCPTDSGQCPVLYTLRVNKKDMRRGILEVFLQTYYAHPACQPYPIELNMSLMLETEPVASGDACPQQHPGEWLSAGEIEFEFTYECSYTRETPQISA